MNELETRLRELGGEIAYPATPRFDLGVAREPARPSWLRPLVLAFAIIVNNYRVPTAEIDATIDKALNRVILFQR